MSASGIYRTIGGEQVASFVDVDRDLNNVPKFLCGRAASPTIVGGLAGFYLGFIGLPLPPLATNTSEFTTCGST